MRRVLCIRSLSSLLCSPRMRTPSPSHKLYYSTDANTNAHNTFIQSNTRFDGAGDSNLPRWVQHIIAKEMDQADKIRKARELSGEQVDLHQLDPSAHKLICKVCTKPNTITVRSCTSCGFNLSKWDVEPTENVFLKIVKGDKSHKVLYRDDTVVVFEDKFKISDYHLDAIPVEPIVDITALNFTHIPMVERLYHKGMEVLSNMVKDVPLYNNKRIEDIVICGFNVPVSVQHLHLHCVLPPLYNVNSFKHPRFHPYTKVHQDLLRHGKVISYHDSPDAVAGEMYYQQRVSAPHYELVSTLKGKT